MEGKYSIYAADDVVGTAIVSREGLYYRFDCQCRLVNRMICKICVMCAGEKTVLGTPIPEGQQFRLFRRLPAKHFAGEMLRFYITGNEEKSELFIEIHENEPFAYLKDLKNATFQVRNGNAGIVVRRK